MSTSVKSNAGTVPPTSDSNQSTGASGPDGSPSGSTKLPDVFTPDPAASDPLSSQETQRGNAPLAPDIAAEAKENRDAMQVPQQYRLVRKLHATEDIWLTQRATDNTKFVAWRWDVPRLSPAFDQLLARGAGDAVAAVLNHPNLVSHIDIQQVPYWHGRDYEYQDYAVSDYMDAGTLRNFIDNTLVLPKINLYTGHVLQWLPEGLVWHVAVSLLSALTWLHEGVREEDTIQWAKCGTASRGSEMETPTDQSEDWWPILHRDIGTDQVFFQHPRGIETYGKCKLGGFGRVFVSGHVHGQAPGTVVTSEDGTSEDELRSLILRAQADLKTRSEGETDPEKNKDLYEDYSDLEYEQRPYFKGTETFKVGVILWQMMTRQLLPDPEACVYCQKNHWTEINPETGAVTRQPSSEVKNEAKDEALDEKEDIPGLGEAMRPCDGWRTGVFQLDEWLTWLSKGADSSQPNAGYSLELIALISQLLDPQTFRRTVSTFDLLDAAKTGYLVWKTTTEEGKRHVDHWDDMVQREKNRRKKEAHDKDVAVKQSGDRAQEYVQLANGGVRSVGR